MKHNKRFSSNFVDKMVSIIQENRAREINKVEKFQWERVRLTSREKSNNITASEFLLI